MTATIIKLATGAAAANGGSQRPHGDARGRGTAAPAAAPHRPSHPDDPGGAQRAARIVAGHCIADCRQLAGGNSMLLASLLADQALILVRAAMILSDLATMEMR